MSLPLAHLSRDALRVGVAALVLCLVWAWWDRAGFFRGYLVAWLFILAITAGGMANLMIHDLTGGRWGAVLRAPLEAATAAMPLVALAGIPLAFGLADLYPWMSDTADPVVAAKHWYLNRPFFLARAVVILATWSVLALALSRDWNVRRTSVAPRPERRLSIVGLILFFATVTVAAVDWIGSLVPQWHSSAFGLRVGVAQALAGFAFATCLAAARGELANDAVAGARARQDIGNLLMMFAMTWAYIAYTEFLIIWAEDLPRETAWFLPRATNAWRWLCIAVFALNFAVPMVGTLFRVIKRSATLLTLLAALVLLGQWLDAVWLVVPSLRPTGWGIPVPEILATLGLAGLWLVAVLRTLGRMSPARALSAEVVAHG